MPLTWVPSYGIQQRVEQPPPAFSEYSLKINLDFSLTRRSVRHHTFLWTDAAGIDPKADPHKLRPRQGTVCVVSSKLTTNREQEKAQQRSITTRPQIMRLAGTGELSLRALTTQPLLQQAT